MIARRPARLALRAAAGGIVIAAAPAGGKAERQHRTA